MSIWRLVITLSSLSGPFTAFAGPMLPFTGPTGTYYLDAGDFIFMVQGTSVQYFPTEYGRGHFEGALAVSAGTIRTRASDLRFGPDLGAGAYLQATGAPTGHGYLTPASGNLRYYDGTGDFSRTYFIDHGQDDPLLGGVYMADHHWQNPQFLFWPNEIQCNNPAPGCWGGSGIAYDSDHGWIWVSARGSSWIAAYSQDGVMRTGFSVGHGNNLALGYDSIDHTLWLITGFPFPGLLMEQYSIFGDFLQQGWPADLPQLGFEAGDFETVPEPAAPILVLLGLAGITGAHYRGKGKPAWLPR